MADVENRDELVSQFVGLTGASPTEAQQYLGANRWDIEGAVIEYFTAHEEGAGGAQDNDENEESYTGPRTLDGRPAPQSAIPAVGSSSRGSKQPKRGGIATLGSYGGSGGQGGPDGDDDSDDSDDPREQPRDLFAGGEKSGLAVQDPSRNDPRSLVNDILKKAKRNAQRPGGESSSSASAAAPSRFRGSGQTLGGDDTPSQTVPDPNPQGAEPEQAQSRILHLWNDGFSVEDGPLLRFDDPANARDLQMIRQGRAPLHLMGARPDQIIDVQLQKHEEDYKAPPKKYKPFSGGGHRLGSPTPGLSSPSATQVQSSAAPAATPVASTTEPQIDPSQPTLALRIQLANGTRLPARFNTTQTIGDVYDFIARASTNDDGREWVLATTFPNKDHTEKDLVLGDVPEFKRGGNAVQKWV